MAWAPGRPQGDSETRDPPSDDKENMEKYGKMMGNNEMIDDDWVHHTIYMYFIYFMWLVVT
jgi:hypothetical protein